MLLVSLILYGKLSAIGYKVFSTKMVYIYIYIYIYIPFYIHRTPWQVFSKDFTRKDIPRYIS